YCMFTHLSNETVYCFTEREIYELIGHPELHRLPTMQRLGSFSELKREQLHRHLRSQGDDHYIARAKDLLVRFERAMEEETPPRAIPIILRFAVAWNDHNSSFESARWRDPYYRARIRFKQACNA